MLGEAVLASYRWWELEELVRDGGLVFGPQAEIGLEPFVGIVPQQGGGDFVGFEPGFFLRHGDLSEEVLNTLHEQFVPHVSLGGPEREQDEAFVEDAVYTGVCILVAFVVSVPVLLGGFAAGDVVGGGMALDLSHFLVVRSSFLNRNPGLFPQVTVHLERPGFAERVRGRGVSAAL